MCETHTQTGESGRHHYRSPPGRPRGRRTLVTSVYQMSHCKCMYVLGKQVIMRMVKGRKNVSAIRKIVTQINRMAIDVQGKLRNDVHVVGKPHGFFATRMWLAILGVCPLCLLP